MQSLRENKLLFYSIGVSTFVIFSLASGMMPELAEYIELVPFPSEVSYLGLLTPWTYYFYLLFAFTTSTYSLHLLLLLTPCTYYFYLLFLLTLSTYSFYLLNSI